MININGFFTSGQSLQAILDLSSTVDRINKLETRLDIDGLLLTLVDLGGDSYKVRVDYSPLNRKGWNRLVEALEPMEV